MSLEAQTGISLIRDPILSIHLLAISHSLITSTNAFWRETKNATLKELAVSLEERSGVADAEGFLI